MTTYRSSLPDAAGVAMTRSSVGEEVRPGEHGLLELREVVGKVRRLDLDPARDLPIALAEGRPAQRHRVHRLPERPVDAEPGGFLAQVRPHVRSAQVLDGRAAAVDRVAEVVRDLLDDDAGPDVAEAIEAVCLEVHQQEVEGGDRLAPDG